MWREMGITGKEASTYLIECLLFQKHYEERKRESFGKGHVDNGKLMMIHTGIHLVRENMRGIKPNSIQLQVEKKCTSYLA